MAGGAEVSDGTGLRARRPLRRVRARAGARGHTLRLPVALTVRALVGIVVERLERVALLVLARVDHAVVGHAASGGRVGAGGAAPVRVSEQRCSGAAAPRVCSSCRRHAHAAGTVGGDSDRRPPLQILFRCPPRPPPPPAPPLPPHLNVVAVTSVRLRLSVRVMVDVNSLGHVLRARARAGAARRGGSRCTQTSTRRAGASAPGHARARGRPKHAPRSPLGGHPGAGLRGARRSARACSRAAHGSGRARWRPTGRILTAWRAPARRRTQRARRRR